MSKLGDFKDKLNYSTCNEDSLTEIEALKINNKDNLLCITGSGGRVLNLLLQNPRKIIAIDFNPTQNWLLELKMAAIKNLNYDEFAMLIGLKDCNGRIELYQRIKHDLSEMGKEYWNKNRRYITKGVLYQGAFVKKCRYLANELQEKMGNKVSKILSFDDIEKQIEYYEKEWDHSFWREKIDIVENTKEIDPAFYLNLKEDYKFESFLIELLDTGFRRHLAKDNHFLCLLIDGNYNRTAKLPLYLREENYQMLKSNLHKIEMVTDNIVDYLKNQPRDYFQKFSLSDVASYLNDNDYDDLYKQLINVASMDSRLCARNLLANRAIPARYYSNIKREEELEKILEERDLSLKYKIIVGSIIK